MTKRTYWKSENQWLKIFKKHTKSNKQLFIIHKGDASSLHRFNCSWTSIIQKCSSNLDMYFRESYHIIHKSQYLFNDLSSTPDFPIIRKTLIYLLSPFFNFLFLSFFGRFHYFPTQLFHTAFLLLVVFSAFYTRIGYICNGLFTICQALLLLARCALHWRKTSLVDWKRSFFFLHIICAFLNVTFLNIDILAQMNYLLFLKGT